MVYKIVEIKYTVLHVMQSCTKKANVMYTGQGNKEQVSQDLKDRFLIFLLITCLLKLTLRKLTQIHSKGGGGITLKLNLPQVEPCPRQSSPRCRRPSACC